MLISYNIHSNNYFFIIQDFTKKDFKKNCNGFEDRS